METADETLLDFVVVGRPVSLQARRRDRVRDWIASVRTASMRVAAPNLPVSTGPVSVQITYYFDEIDMDVDNIAKPVLDALKGGVLGDDKQVYELIVRKREAAPAKRSPSVPTIVSEALAPAPELVHVVLRALPSEDERG